MQAICPHCSTLNRVSGARALAGARCGRCKNALFPGKPIELNETEFDRYLQRSGVPLLVDFWARWCGPCQQMMPVVTQAAERLATRLIVAKIDTEAHRNVASRLGIRSIPTMILYRDGREHARVAGAMNLERLLAWTEQQLA
jgi:thioredoxin 2